MIWDAFISYSHSVDGQLAPALQSALQGLARPWYRKRALHVFRDRTALSADPSLWGRIVEALDGARYLVLLMSPQSAGSTWVNREIEHWLATKGVGHLLPVLTEGALEWDSERGDFRPQGSPSLPPALRGAFSEEPRYVDLRWAREEIHLDLRNAAFLDAVADLAAPIHGQPKDELVGEDVRRHRQTRRVVEAVVITLAVLLAAAVWSAYRAEQRRIEAVAQRLLVQSRTMGDAPDLAFLLAAESHRMHPDPNTEGGIMAALQLHQERELRRLWRTACTSRNGNDTAAYSVLLLPERGWVVYGDEDGVVAFADARTGAIVRRVALGPEDAIVSLAADPSRDRIIAVSVARVLFVPLAEGPVVDGQMSSQTLYLDGVYDPRTRRLALIQLDAPLEIWDLATDERTARLDLAEDRAVSVAFHPNEPMLFIGTTGGAIRAMDPGTGSDGLWTLPNAHQGGVLSLAVSRDGARLLSGGGDGVVRLWDVASRALLKERRSHTGSVWDLGFTVNHPRGDYLASVGADGDLNWIDANLLAPYPPTRLHRGRINDIDFAADGTYATAGSDGVVALFDADQSRLVAGRRTDLGMAISSISVDPSGQRFAVASGPAGSITLLDGASEHGPSETFTAGSPVTASAYHPSGRTLALGTGDGRVLLWEPGSGEAAAFAAHQGEVVDLAFHPNGATLVTLGGDRRVLQWTLAEDGMASPRVLDEQGWRALAFDSDGSLLAVGSADGSVRVIRTATGEDVAVLHEDPPIFPTRIAFHPRRPLLVAGDGYGVVRFWDSRTFRESLPRLSGHHGEINGLVFHVAQGRLLTSGRDAVVRLWELDRRELVAALSGHQGVIRALAFSEVRSELASGGLDGLVIRRSLAVQDWLKDGCSLYSRTFTPDEAVIYALDSHRQPLCPKELLCPPTSAAVESTSVVRTDIR
jgi:WD40 repeat protein